MTGSDACGAGNLRPTYLDYSRETGLGYRIGHAAVGGHPLAGLDICDCCVRPQTLAHTREMHTIAVPHITSPACNILSTPASPVVPPCPRLSPCPVRARVRVRSTPAGQEPPRSSAARPRPSPDTPHGPAAHPHVVPSAAETHDAAPPGVSLGPAESVCDIRSRHPPPAGYTAKHEAATVHGAPVEREATDPQRLPPSVALVTGLDDDSAHFCIRSSANLLVQLEACVRSPVQADERLPLQQARYFQGIFRRSEEAISIAIDDLVQTVAYRDFQVRYERGAGVHVQFQQLFDEEVSPRTQIKNELEELHLFVAEETRRVDYTERVLSNFHALGSRALAPTPSVDLASARQHLIKIANLEPFAGGWDDL